MSKVSNWTQFANAKVILFTWNVFQNEYPNHLANIAKSMKKVNAQLRIVSSSFITQPYRSQFRETDYWKILEGDYGAKVTFVSPHMIQKRDDKMIRDFLHLEEVKEISEELYFSILSGWLSRNQTTLVDRELSKREGKILREELNEYKFWENTTRDLLDSESYDFVIIHNGRHHANVAVKQVAIRKNIKIFYFESGVPKSKKLFLESFQIQDVQSMNEMFSKLIATMSKTELDFAKDWASLWCVRNSTDKTVNPFVKDTKGQKRKKETSRGTNSRTVPIYNSSLDERISNLGVHMNGWGTQNNAIVAMANKLRDHKFEPLVRIHPNTGWKSWSELLELVQVLKLNGVNYVLPWESVSSYSLMDEAPLVISWGSTIALEATARGIPTVNLGRSSFDLLFDVTLISKEDLDVWKPNDVEIPNRDSSLIAIYIVNNYGMESERNNWVQECRIPYSKTKHWIKKMRILFTKAFSLFGGDLGSRPYDIYFWLKRFTGELIAHKIMARIVNFYLKKKFVEMDKN